MRATRAPQPSPDCCAQSGTSTATCPETEASALGLPWPPHASLRSLSWSKRPSSKSPGSRKRRSNTSDSLRACWLVQKRVGQRIGNLRPPAARLSGVFGAQHTPRNLGSRNVAHA